MAVKVEKNYFDIKPEFGPSFGKPGHAHAVAFVAEKNLQKNTVRLNMLLESPPTAVNPIGETFSVAPPELTFVKVGVTEGLPNKPTFEFHRSEVEALMTELWNIGIRPKYTIAENKQDPNVPELVKAMQEHIHDLQAQIAFLSGIIADTMQLKK